MKKILSLLLSVLMVLTLTACSSGFKGGTFEGSAKGFSSDIKLKVTISDEKVITGITRESADTSNIGEAAMDNLTEKVLASNSVDVDAVAGATLSSNGFIEALNAALKAAGLSAADLKAVEGAAEGDAIVNNREGITVDNVLGTLSSLPFKARTEFYKKYADLIREAGIQQYRRQGLQ